MNNREIASILFNISSILEEHDRNPYRIRAYRRAALNLLRLGHEVADRARAGEPLGVPLLGKRLTAKITEMALEGRSDFYDDLCGILPSAEQVLVHVPGIGPKLAHRISLGLATDDATTLLQRAAVQGLQTIDGIGPKRAAQIAAHLPTQAAPAGNTVARDGNVLYIQERLWKHGRREEQAA